ncbi:MAG: histidine kinase dimerization/phospho-acceptor domain-containing protein [Pseudomonadota bacterium]
MDTDFSLDCYLALDPFRLALAADIPCLIWHRETSRLVAANPAAAHMFRLTDITSLVASPPNDRQPGFQHIGRIAPQLAPGKPRVERLRFFAGFRPVMLQAMVTVPDDRDDLVIITAIEPPPGAKLSAAQKAQMIAPYLGGTGEIRDGDGATLARVGTADGPSPRTGPEDAILPLEPSESGIVLARWPDETVEAESMPRVADVSAEAVPASDDVTPSSEDTNEISQLTTAETGTRFRIDLDGAGRVLTTEPPANTLGLADLTTAGRALPALVRDLMPEAGDRLGQALAGRDTFSGIAMPWPLEDGHGHAEIALAALPRVDAEQRFCGFRGFGVIEALVHDARADMPAQAVTDHDHTGQDIAEDSDAVSDSTPEPHERADEQESLPPDDRQAFEAIAAALTGSAAVTAATTDTPMDRTDFDAGDDTLLDDIDQNDLSDEINADLANVASDFDSETDVSVSTFAPTANPDTPVNDDGPSDMPPISVPGDTVTAAFTEDEEDATRPHAAAGLPGDLLARLGALFGAAPGTRRDTTDADVIAPDANVNPADADGETTDSSETTIAALNPHEIDDANPQLIDATVARLASVSASSGLGPVSGIDMKQAFTDLVDRLPLGLLFFRDNEALHANPAFLALFGYADLDDLEIAGGISALFENYAKLDHEEGIKRVLHGVTRDGDPVDVEARLQLARWLDGPALLLSARERAKPDLTPLIDAKTDLIELENILDTATDGFVVLDGSGAIERLNESAEALFGFDSHEIEGKHFSTLIAPDAQAEVETYFESLQGNGLGSVLNDGREVMGRVKQGGDVPLFLTFGKIGTGPRERYCAVLRDMTPWKTAETELVAARTQAERANRHKSDFLARVSHEIRTPLNAIIGFAEVMREERFGPIGNDRYREYVEDIKTSGEHMMSLINDLLDLSKIEAGRLDLAMQPVQLNDIAEQCVAIMQAEANRNRVILRTSLGHSMPQVTADTRSVRQILLNLLSNGVSFTEPGGQVIVSTVLDSARGVILRVRDTGIGMNAHDVEEAMEPFRQVRETVRGERKGSGLGLPLVRALAEANRADFTIDSKPNQGTMVEISFPRAS